MADEVQCRLCGKWDTWVCSKATKENPYVASASPSSSVPYSQEQYKAKVKDIVKGIKKKKTRNKNNKTANVIVQAVEDSRQTFASFFAENPVLHHSLEDAGIIGMSLEDAGIYIQHLVEDTGISLEEAGIKLEELILVEQHMKNSS